MSAPFLGLDLFAGAGGLSLGFSAAGIDIAAALDHDPSAVRTLRANPGCGPAIVVKRDIRRFGPRAMDRMLSGLYRRSRPQLIMAGPPCQGWSMVGRGKLRSLGRLVDGQDPFRDPRNRLFRAFLRYVAYFEPVACVMENVPGMSHYFGVDVSKVVYESISALGYDVVQARIEASDLGIPQRRTRLVFVGIREDLGLTFRYPDGPPEDLGLPKREMVVRDALRDLPWVPVGSRKETMKYRPVRPRSKYARLLRPSWMNGTIEAHVTRWHGEQDLAAFRALRQGGIYRELPPELRRYRVDIFEDKYRRLSWDEPSPCLTAHLAKDCYSHIHPSQARTISVREAARLQGFPDWYQLEGSMGDRYRLVGNAVSPLVSYAIARSLLESLGCRPRGDWSCLSEQQGRAVHGGE